MLVLTHSQSSILSCWSISDTICKSQNLRICFLTLLNHVAHTMAKYSLGVINRPYGCNMYLSSQVLQESLEDRFCCLFFFLCLMNLEFSKIKKKIKKRRRKLTRFYMSSFHQWKSNTLSSKIIFFHPLVSFQAINTLKVRTKKLKEINSLSLSLSLSSPPLPTSSLTYSNSPFFVSLSHLCPTYLISF